MTSPPDRSVDIALAEFNALRAELLAHTASQNALLGVGFTAISVIVGLAVNNPARSPLLIIVPVLCGVLLVVYAGLAYRIVIVGNYVRLVLWPFLTRKAAVLPPLPSWEASLAAVEHRRPHRWLKQIVEIALGLLLLVVGIASGVAAADIGPWWRVVALGFLGATTLVAGVLGRRLQLTRDQFEDPRGER